MSVLHEGLMSTGISSLVSVLQFEDIGRSGGAIRKRKRGNVGNPRGPHSPLSHGLSFFPARLPEKIGIIYLTERPGQLITRRHPNLPRIQLLPYIQSCIPYSPVCSVDGWGLTVSWMYKNRTDLRSFYLWRGGVVRHDCQGFRMRFQPS